MSRRRSNTPSPATLRKRRQRARDRQGTKPYTVEVDEEAVVSWLIESRRLTETEGLDKDRVSEELSRFLHEMVK